MVSKDIKYDLESGGHDSQGFSHTPIREIITFFYVALEFNVTIHEKNVGTAGNVVKEIQRYSHVVKHDREGALCLRTGGGIVDIGDQEALNTFTEAIDLLL